MNTEMILAILRLVLPVVTTIVNIFHGKAQAETAAQKAVDNQSVA